MDRQRFNELQPVAFQTISNSISNKHFAHAYLLYGNKGVQLQEYAKFLIQSLLCEEPQNDLACGQCNNCQRIARDIYADLVVLSGEDRLIGKKEILQLMNQLNKTGLEHKSLKFYLINEVDNATTEALNSLLKFLEEPGNESTYAILTTHQIDRVLPTIVSRCLKVPFWGYKKDNLLESIDGEKDNSENYLLTNIAQSPSKANALKDDEVFNRASNVFKKNLKVFFSNLHESLVTVEKDGLIDKNSDKEFLTYWLALNIQFLKDLSYLDNIPSGWYKELLNDYQIYRNISVKMLPIFLSAYDQLNRSLNLRLLMERMFWQLKEVTV